LSKKANKLVKLEKLRNADYLKSEIFLETPLVVLDHRFLVENSLLFFQCFLYLIQIFGFCFDSALAWKI
jgi:hypothetical protein